MAINNINGLDRILTDIIVTPETVIDVIVETKTAYEKQVKKCEERINIYLGNQEDDIPDTNSNIDEKIVINITQHIIDLLVAITHSNDVILTLKDSDSKKQADLDEIIKHLDNANFYNVNIEQFRDCLITGLGNAYSIQNNSELEPILLGSFDPETICIVQSYDIKNPVVLTYAKSTINKIINGESVQIDRYTAFDSKYKYIIESDEKADSGYKIIETSLHGLPYNPIQHLETSRYRLSLIDTLKGFRVLTNTLFSNCSNDVLKKVNQLLVILGADIDKEMLVSAKENGVMVLPSNPNGQNPQITLVGSQLDSWILNFLQMIMNLAEKVAGIPAKSGGGRAEATDAVAMQDGYLLSSFLSNVREVSLEIPIRKTIANIIEILRRHSKVTSEIQSSDITITFDHNRLLNIRELATTLETMIRTGVPAIESIKLLGISANVNEIASGIEKNRQQEQETANKQEEQKAEITTVEETIEKEQDVDGKD